MQRQLETEGGFLNPTNKIYQSVATYTTQAMKHGTAHAKGGDETQQAASFVPQVFNNRWDF